MRFISAFVLVAVVLFAGVGLAQETTATGFYYPTGSSDLGTYWDWLAVSGAYYHLAKDIQADLDDPVYAVDDGVVLSRSTGGWDNIPGDSYSNIALLVHHQLADGTDYIAVYGHVISSLQPDDPVTAGQQIATIGPWDSFDHLHFGIHPGLDITAPYGWIDLPVAPPYNGFTNPITWIETQDPGLWTLASISSPLVISPTRSNPATVFALPDEYGVGSPSETEKNFTAHYTIQNTSGSSLILDNYGVEVFKGVDHQFFLREDVSVTLADGETALFDMRGWITEDRLTGGSSTEFTLLAQCQISGVWYDLPAGGTGQLTVEPRPVLTNGMIIKRPRIGDDPDPEAAKMFYHQWGYKWGLESETDANTLFPGWATEFYVYPEFFVANLGDPISPDYNSTLPVIAGRNLIYKKTGYATVYIIEPEPDTSSPPVSRPFDTEEAFWSYGYSNTAIPNDIVSQTIELGPEADWLLAQYPVGSTITSTTTFVVDVGGTINEDAHWTADHIYRVTSDLTIASGVTLTIDPGTVVKFSGRDHITCNGTLVAVGTVAEPIVFTSDHDDDIDGHDTNGDGSATEPLAGDWEYILLAGPDSRLEHCLIRHCGYYNPPVYVRHRTTVVDDNTIEYVESHSPAAIRGDNVAFSVSGNVIRYAPNGITMTTNPAYLDIVTIAGNVIDVTGDGISFNGSVTMSELHVTGNTVTCDGSGTALIINDVRSGSTVTGNDLDNGAVGLYLDDATLALAGNELDGNELPVVFFNDVEADLSGNTYPNSGRRVLAHRGTMSLDHQWGELLGGTFRHCVDTDLTIASGATLTIDPGTVVKFSGRDHLTCNGTLLAVGTVAEPIVFTSDHDDDIDGHDTNGDGSATEPLAGDWEYILLAGPDSRLEHCLIRHCGYYNPPVYVRHRTTVVDDNTIEYVESHSPAAIRGDNVAFSVSGNVIRYAPNGITMTTNPAYLDIVTIAGNVIDVTGDGISFNGSVTMSELHVTGNTVTCDGSGTALIINDVRSGSTVTGNDLDNGAVGLYLDDATLALAGNELDGNELPVVFFNDVEADLSGNTYPNSGRRVLAHRGTMSLDHQWGELLGGTFRHCVDTDLTIASGATLTIDPGTVVKFSGRDHLTCSGTLVAVGTEVEPIVFTSDKDDDIDGHDSNGDGSTTEPLAGDWEYILLTGPNSRLEHCLIRYCGYYNYPVYVRHRTTVVDDNTIEYVESHSPGAIRGDDVAFSVSGNTIRFAPHGITMTTNPAYPDTVTLADNVIDVTGSGISFNGSVTTSVLHVTGNTVTCDGSGTALSINDVRAGSSVTGNDLDNGAVGLYLDDATLDLVGNELDGNDLPVVFFNDVEADLDGNEYLNCGREVLAHRGTMSLDHQWGELLNGTFRHCIDTDLTLASGATLTIDPGTVVKFSGRDHFTCNGTLVAVGTEVAPIVFTSAKDSYVDGHDTNGDGGATEPLAGDWEYILLTGPNSRLEHCLIRYCGYYNYPVYVRHRATVVDNNTIEYVESHSGAAIRGDNVAFSVSGNTIRFAPNGISMTTNPAYPDTVTIADNVIDVTGNGISFNGNKDTSVVTVTGNTVHGDGSGTGVYAQDLRAGSLIVVNGIYGTSTGLSLSVVSASCLQNTLWQDAANTGTGKGLDVGNDCVVLLEGNVVSGFERGVEGYVTGGTSPSTIHILGNQIIDNAEEGIYLASSNASSYDGPEAVINNNDIYGNGLSDLYVGDYQDPSTRHIDATANWWGTANPAAVPALIQDRTDGLTGSPTVDYLPILTEASGLLEGSLWITPSSISLNLFPDTQTVRDVMLGNRGTQTLSYSLLEAADAPEKTDIGWMDIAASSGTVEPGETGVANVAFNSDTLSDGHYSAHIVVESDDPVNDLVVVPVQMEVAHVFLNGPAAGDTLDVNDIQPLAWSVYDPGQVVALDLAYSTDGGDSFPHVIAVDLPNQSPYMWDVSAAVGDSCAVMITVHYQGGSEYSNMTSSFFSIVDPDTDVEDGAGVPQLVVLKQNYPNPFNPSTTISYSTHESRRVDLSVFDTKGRLVKRLVNDTVSAGEHSIQWLGLDEQGNRVASGLYFYCLDTGDCRRTMRMVLIK